METLDFLSAYVEYAQEFCHAPGQFHRFAAMNALSTALGSRVRMAWGDNWIYPNLWLLLLAESSISAKTTAMKISSRIMSQVPGMNMFPNEFSREGLVKLLEEHKSGTFLISEFSQFMGLTRAGYNEGVLGFLTDIYDVPETYRRVLQKGEFNLVRPCVNILACSTPDYMSANEDEWMSGFGPRFLLIADEATRFIPIPPPSDERKRNKLACFLRNAQTVRGIAVFEEPDMYADWATRQWKDLRRRPSLERAWSARVRDYVVKIAMIIEIAHWTALWDHGMPKPDSREAFLSGKVGKIKISQQSLMEAIDLCDEVSGKQLKAYAESSVVSTKYSKQMESVVQAIAHFGNPAKRTDVLRRTKMPRKVLDEIVNTLVEMGRVQRIFKMASKGAKRKTEFLSLVMDQEARTVPEGDKEKADFVVQPPDPQVLIPPPEEIPF